MSKKTQWIIVLAAIAIGAAFALVEKANAAPWQMATTEDPFKKTSTHIAGTVSGGQLLALSCDSKDGMITLKVSWNEKAPEEMLPIFLASLSNGVDNSDLIFTTAENRLGNILLYVKIDRHDPAVKVISNANRQIHFGTEASGIITSFSARGSTSSVNKMLKACPEVKGE